MWLPACKGWSSFMATPLPSMTQPTAHDGYRKALRYGAACHEACAFSIRDHELALRWASLATPTGYRVFVSADGTHGGELILVHLPGRQSPVFAIQALHSTVVLIDCLGMTMRFPTLLDALLAMAPVPKSGRGELLRGARPPCIAGLPNFLTRAQPGFSRRIATTARTALHRAWTHVIRQKRPCQPG